MNFNDEVNMHAGAGVPDAHAMQQMMHQQAQAIQALQAQLHQQQQAAPQQLPPQAAAPPPHRIIATIGQLEVFTGSGSASAAQQWLKKTEYRFGVAEAMLGVAGTPPAFGARMLATAAALTDEADRWFTSMPQQPNTWDEFRVAFLRRFAGVATTDAKISELQRLVQAGQRIREKLTVDGLRRYAAQFLQLAGEIPPAIMSDYLKRKTFAEGLPQKHAEYALSKNRAANPPDLHVLVDDILARALDRAMSSSTLGHASSHHGDDMQLDAISLCAAQFGVSREEAARYVEPGEGWAPHDTDARSSAPAKSPASSSSEGMEERLLAAFEARFKALASSSGNSSSGSQGKSQPSRRYVPSGVKDQIPEAMIEARKAAGLCVKCGVVKYEGGGRGHNAKTCKAGFDKTTSVAEEKKKAGF